MLANDAEFELAGFGDDFLDPLLFGVGDFGDDDFDFIACRI